VEHAGDGVQRALQIVDVGQSMIADHDIEDLARKCLSYGGIAVDVGDAELVAVLGCARLVQERD